MTRYWKQSKSLPLILSAPSIAPGIGKTLEITRPYATNANKKEICV